MRLRKAKLLSSRRVNERNMRRRRTQRVPERSAFGKIVIRSRFGNGAPYGACCQGNSDIGRA